MNTITTGNDSWVYGYDPETKPHRTLNKKNSHSQVYTNLNVMTVPSSTSVKQVDFLDFSKHDILNL